jgi:nicotinamidase-related amidase
MSQGLKRGGAARSRAALLLIDVVNDMDFPGSEVLVRQAERMAPRLAKLAERAREADVPVIYVNDNFGQWRSDWRNVVRHCLGAQAPGRRVAELLQPHESDYFVLKPKHSGFFSTTLDLLLVHLGVRSVLMGGFATDICILFTANDAYMRDYRVIVPRDCVAANTRHKTEFTLGQIRDVLKGGTPSSRTLTVPALRALRRGRSR